MAKFQRAGRPDPAFSKLDLHVDETVKIDLLVTPQDVLDIKSLFVACFGLSAAAKEVASPMSKVIRRFEVTGKSAGASVLVAAGPVPAAPFSLLVFNPGLFSLLAAKLPVDVRLTPQQAFIERLSREAGSVSKKFKLPMSILVGVACVESAYGTGPHAAKNLYGITKRKGQDWFPSCSVTEAGSTTAIAGQGQVGDSFCKADSYEHSARIFGEFVTGHPGNGAIRGLFTGGPWKRGELERLADGLHTGLNFGKGKPPGAYKSLVMSVIDQYRLTRFDP